MKQRKTLGHSAAGILFLGLAIFEIVRTLRHAMWRDELQAFMLASNSATLTELFGNLKYEGHPALWHLLLWGISAWTADPFAMQVLHAAIAVSIWLLIYFFSPFSILEKFLILASYFLFYEYFIISRSYALMTLLGFAYVVVTARHRQVVFAPWIILGLLANTTLFGAIWSLALAAVAFARRPAAKSTFLWGAASYAVLFAGAVATMLPAPDFSIYERLPRFSMQQASMAAIYPATAFVPFVPPWFSDSLRWLGGPFAWLDAHFGTIGVPQKIMAVFGLHSGGGVKLVLVLIVPIAACWAITRDRLRTAEFALVCFGTVLFAVLWQFPGAPRHHGILFVAFLGVVWAWRAAGNTPARGASWLWFAILIVNAIAGVMTLSSEFRPFSQGRAVAAFIERRGLADKPIIGLGDYAASTVAGYLRRPIYYLECECRGTFIVWSTRRNRHMDSAEVARRLRQALEPTDRRQALLIADRRLSSQEEAAMADIKVTLLRRFDGAAVADENYVLYRVSKD